VDAERVKTEFGSISSTADRRSSTDSCRWRRKTAKPKLPFVIAMKDGRPFTFAGLWEGWKDPESGEWLRTCTIITGEPNELVAQIHPRMPVILPDRHHSAWGSGSKCAEIYSSVLYARY
jgi:putative SOS response-associated peptidase YedK